jgi:hypothetical protein
MSFQDQPRDRGGRFREYEHSAPEISLAAPLSTTRAVYDLYRQAGDSGTDTFAVFAEIASIEGRSFL